MREREREKKRGSEREREKERERKKEREREGGYHNFDENKLQCVSRDGGIVND